MKRRVQSLECQMEVVGVLARHIPTRLIEISRSGCLLESAHRIEEGTVGALRLEVRGPDASSKTFAPRAAWPSRDRARAISSASSSCKRAGPMGVDSTGHIGSLGELTMGRASLSST